MAPVLLFLLFLTPVKLQASVWPETADTIWPAPIPAPRRVRLDPAQAFFSSFSAPQQGTLIGTEHFIPRWQMFIHLSSVVLTFCTSSPNLEVRWQLWRIWHGPKAVDSFSPVYIYPCYDTGKTLCILPARIPGEEIVTVLSRYFHEFSYFLSHYCMFILLKMSNWNKKRCLKMSLIKNKHQVQIQKAEPKEES